MDIFKIMLGSLSLVMMIALLPALVFASSDGHSHPFDTGRDFGEHHSLHAQEGHLGQDMNPGVHHQGFSPWAPGN